MSEPPRTSDALNRVLLIGSCAALFSACGKKDEEAEVIRPVRTSVVEAAPTTIQRTYPAIVLAARQADLAFRVPGRIVEMPVLPPDKVKKGDLIAQLEPREFEAAVARLRTELEQANAQLRVMKTGAREEDVAAFEAKVAAAKVAVKNQQAQVDRLSRVVERGGVARAELEREQAKLKSEETALEVAEQDLRKARVGARPEDIEAQEALVRGLEVQFAEAEADLRDTALRAPFDGMVAKRATRKFTNVQANDTVVVLQNIETVNLGFDMPGVDVAKLGKYHETIVTKARLDIAPGREFEAELGEFGTQAEAATQTFRGEVSIPYPEDLVVLPGMTGSIVSTATPEGVEEEAGLVVPQAALGAEPDGSSYVWVVTKEDQRVSRRDVTAGAVSGSGVSVRGDLAAGDVVVTAGVSFLSEGMKVRSITDNGN